MKILHVIGTLAPRYGGPAKACVEMARCISRLGHKLSIYTTNMYAEDQSLPLDAPIMRDGVEIRYFPIQFPRLLGTSLPLGRALKNAIPQYDLVHIHSLYFYHNMVAGYYCQRYGVPYIIRPHGTLDPFIYSHHRWRKSIIELLFQNRNIKKAAALHYTSLEEKSLAAPYVFNAPGIVVSLGLYPDDYNPLPMAGLFREKHPEIGDKQIILFLGRLNFKKGLDILVKAFAITARTRPDVHLVIAGPDDDGLGDKVRVWLKREGALEQVTFTGMIVGSEKLAAFRDANIFVLPSYSENFGISVAEAMACELPVVISDKVNIYQEVKQADAGIITSCDHHDVAKALITLVDNPGIGDEMGKKGRLLVRQRFSWDQVALSLEEAYRTIIQNRFLKLE